MGVQEGAIKLYPVPTPPLVAQKLGVLVLNAF